MNILLLNNDTQRAKAYVEQRMHTGLMHVVELIINGKEIPHPEQPGKYLRELDDCFIEIDRRQIEYRYAVVKKSDESVIPCKNFTCLLATVLSRWF